MHRTRSRPLMPEFFPAACWASLALRIASASASFLSIRVRFHFANVSGVTGVKFDPSLCRFDRVRQTRSTIEKQITATSTSRKSSKLIVLAFSASSAALR